MNEKKVDYLGWILLMTAALLAIIGAFQSGSAISFYFAGAIVLLVVYEKIPTKIVTASLYRVADEKGGIRGLIAFDGVGVQIGIRSDSLNNSAVAWPILWQESPSVGFSFGVKSTVTSKGTHDRAPSLGLSGFMAKQSRRYSIDFSYDDQADRPIVSACIDREGEVKVEGATYDGFVESFTFKFSE